MEEGSPIGPRINFKHLWAFAAVAANGSMRKAAELVGLSEPAISQALRNVERVAGHDFFERRARGMIPTAAGAVLLRRIDQARRLLEVGGTVTVPRGRSSGASGRLANLATAIQWRALIAVVEHGGYSQAARALGVSEPSVHRAARSLEQLCGRVLFSATPYGVEPTADARELARLAALAHGEIAMGYEELRELSGIMDGRLSIGCLPLARTSILPAAVTRLLSQRPDARVSIVDGGYTELLSHLRHGRVDVILGALRQPPPEADILQEPLFDDPLAIIVRAGHPILGAPDNPAALAELEWIAPRAGTPGRSQFLAFFTARRVAAPRRIIECSSLVAIRGLLLQSDRAAVLSARQALYEARSGQLAVAAELTGTERPIGIAVRSGSGPTRLQSEFLAIVREVAALEARQL